MDLELRIDKELCSKAMCDKCYANQQCPSWALMKIDPEEPVTLQKDLCSYCARCIPYCKGQALSIQRTDGKTAAVGEEEA